MSVAAVAPIVMLVAQYALQYGIPAAQKLVALFRKESVTEEDWNELFAISQKGHDQYIAEAQARMDGQAVPPAP